MRRLPALAAGPNRWILPMADRSAAVLAEVLVADEAPELTQPLAEQLMGDPPLVLWAVCTAAHGDPFRPRSVREVAQWLQKHAVQTLRWDGKRARRFDASKDRKAEQFADRVAAGLEVADLAAFLASADGEAAAEETYLTGLLADAREWLSLAAGRLSPSAAEDCLPDWLANPEPGLITNHVAEAVGVFTLNAIPESVDFDLETCRRRAIEGRRNWLEVVSGPGSRLPVLTAKLARLETLENRFQKALETEKLEALAEFAAGAGHEINNPLAIIGGRAQLLLKEETDPERRRELALMNAQVRRAHEMIADMRLFSRPPRPEPETIDLVGLVDTLVAELAGQMAQRATSLRRTGEDGPLEIEADPAQLNVALQAMCRNSLEAIGRDGHIEIDLRRAAENAEIRVIDDGPGILPEVRRHLFDPFYSARQAGRGLGFGLSKAWRIITNHGGRIEVESEPGRGAVFTVTLPRKLSRKR